jgi:hypothetical protein
MWNIIALASWVVSAALVIWMVYDWVKTDRTHSEADLTSSREGEIEAIAEKHKVQ